MASKRQIKKKQKANSPIQKDIKISQKRVKEYQAAIREGTFTNKMLNQGHHSKAVKELNRLNQLLTKTIDQAYLRKEKEKLKTLKGLNSEIKAENRKYREAESKAKNYNWYDDYELDNVQQYLAIKKYHEWVSKGLIRESSVLDKYQYVKYLEDIASPEMLQELVDEYEPTLERVLENDRKQRAAAPVLNWSEIWG